MKVICPYCKTDQPISPYLAAHWHESMVGTCCKESCKKKFLTKRGIQMKMKEEGRDETLLARQQTLWS
jgi:hypothetical protein